MARTHYAKLAQIEHLSTSAEGAEPKRGKSGGAGGKPASGAEKMPAFAGAQEVFGTAHNVISQEIGDKPGPLCGFGDLGCRDAAVTLD
jgi:hypothetical protein